MMGDRARAALATAATLLSTLAPARAGTLPRPAGEVVLTVSGDVGETNGGGVAAFDLAMLDALPLRVVETSTPWHPRPARFEGPGLADVLARVGATGHAVVAHAINDYEVEVPAGDAARGAVVATRRDGSRMGVRDKGPLFLVYPFDADPALRTKVFYARSVWQLDALRVR